MKFQSRNHSSDVLTSIIYSRDLISCPSLVAYILTGRFCAVVENTLMCVKIITKLANLKFIKKLISIHMNKG